MGNARQRRIQQVFQEAMEQPPEALDTFLRDACGGDGLLAREVRSLLRGVPAGSGFFRNLSQRVEQAVSPMIGARIGPWKLLAEVGRGGMGTVYRAERDDGQFTQRVALKTLRLGAADAQAAERFLNERALLARLEHPCIARLIDGGLTHDHTPYLVMEYVDGAPIDRWVREGALSIDARLRLFQQVCHAVSYAHRNLIIHRDLKPTNVLVTDDGDAKLLDFGIAKALDGGETGDLTQEGATLMTPRYAAPELLQGEAATTLADVYSLGVLLFELLTDRPAYAPSTDLSSLVQQICRDAPCRPSQAVDDGALGRRLRGDLDTIVLRAMAKAPQARYPSVESLCGDVGCYLRKEPILARAPFVTYRIGKFLRRNRMASLLGAIATVAILAVASVSGVAAVRFQAQNATIAMERDRANEVQQFLVDLFALATPEAGDGAAVTAEALLTRGADRVQGELAGRPQLQAHLARAIGQAFTSLSLYPQARASLEQARDYQGSVPGPTPPMLASILTDLATVQERQGEYSAALATAERAAELVHDADSLASARVSQLRARVLHRQGKLDEASPLYRQALAAARAGDDDAFLTDALINFATFTLATGDARGAITLTREGLERLESAYGERDIRLAEPLHNLATALASEGHWREAAVEYRRALALTALHLAPDHQTNAFLFNGLARAEQRLGETARARVSFQRSLAILRANFGEVHPDIGIGLANLGRLEFDEGQLRAAHAAFAEALAILDETLPGHWIGHDVRRRLGTTQTEAGHYALAEPLLLQAHEALRDSLGEAHEATRSARAALASLYARWNQPDLAARYGAKTGP